MVIFSSLRLLSVGRMCRRAPAFLTSILRAAPQLVALQVDYADAIEAIEFIRARRGELDGDLGRQRIWLFLLISGVEIRKGFWACNPSPPLSVSADNIANQLRARHRGDFKYCKCTSLVLCNCQRNITTPEIQEDYESNTYITAADNMTHKAYTW